MGCLAESNARSERVNTSTVVFVSQDKGDNMLMKFAALGDALSRTDERHLYRLSSRLSRYFRDIVTIEWNLSRQGRRHVAACKVHATSGYYRAEVISGRLSTSMGKTLHKLVRQRRREKAVGRTLRRIRPESDAM